MISLKKYEFTRVKIHGKRQKSPTLNSQSGLELLSLNFTITKKTITEIDFNIPSDIERICVDHTAIRAFRK